MCIYTYIHIYIHIYIYINKVASERAEFGMMYIIGSIWSTLATDDCDRKHVLDVTHARLRCDGSMVPRAKSGGETVVVQCAGKAKLHASNCSRMLWMPVSYHPWWSRYIKKAARRVNEDSYLAVLRGSAFGTSHGFRMRVAWKNFLPSNVSLLQGKAWSLWMEVGCWCRASVLSFMSFCWTISTDSELFQSKNFLCVMMHKPPWHFHSQDGWFLCLEKWPLVGLYWALIHRFWIQIEIYIYIYESIIPPDAMFSYGYPWR